jgi:hypothetical protein
MSVCLTQAHNKRPCCRFRIASNTAQFVIVYIMTALNGHCKYNLFEKSVRLRYCAPSLLQEHPVTECNISKERSSQPHRFIGLKTYNPLIVVVTASKMSHCTAGKYLCLPLYCFYMFKQNTRSVTGRYNALDYIIS